MKRAQACFVNFFPFIHNLIAWHSISDLQFDIQNHPKETSL